MEDPCNTALPVGMENKKNYENSISSNHAPLEGSLGKIQIMMRFLPLLLLYISIVMLGHNDSFWGDEGRYVMFATNLSNGYYSPLDKVYLWNGPGYPIVLLPFVILKLPWLAAKLLNPFLLFTAILFFYYTLRFYIKERSALFFSYMLGLYPPFCRFIYMVLPEQLAVFLVCGFLFHFCKLHKENEGSWVQILITSLYLGFLALTKIFFGYVILAGLLLWLCYFLWEKGQAAKKTLLIYLIAFLFCVPYLLYTYSLTGKIFYWGNSGGHALFLMSTAYEDGFGDWELLIKHREEMYNGLGITTETEIDDEKDIELKMRAINNIIHSPSAYLKNWMANIGRLWFNYPSSYTTQQLSNYFYFLPNMFLFVLSILCIYPTYLGRKIIPFEIYAVILFGLISLTGSSLMFITNRQIWPLVPVLGVWMSFAFARFVRVNVS